MWFLDNCGFLEVIVAAQSSSSRSMVCSTEGAQDASAFRSPVSI
jgi:hypothetical protein